MKIEIRLVDNEEPLTLDALTYELSPGWLVVYVGRGSEVLILLGERISSIRIRIN